MGRDDSATLAGLKAHRQGLIDPKIAEYSGRIVKTTGDGLLLEFPSVVDAVRCAVDVQRGMAERNAGVSPEQRIQFRMGINVGDIIIDGDDIFGDGVNVAARLQTLAEPGGICVSRIVRDQVLYKLSFAFEDLGSQQVKNIARPVEAYLVDLASGAVEIAGASESSAPPVPARQNLPQLMTSFIGHEDDLDEYAILLGETRLLTLTGIGGCGKTRLAIELAERVLSSFPDGVCYVDLAPILDAERVALTVSTMLGIREENDRPIVDTLCDRLANRHMLLVLDNCEHLVAVCAALVQRVIGAARGVRVLTASREGLGVSGERIVTVRSLSFPPSGSKL